MKRTIVYVAVAMVLGIALTLVPLITLAQLTTNQYPTLSPEKLSHQLNDLEGTRPYVTIVPPSAEVQMLAVSFFLALIVYFLFRRRASGEGYRTVGPYPY